MDKDELEQEWMEEEERAILEEKAKRKRDHYDPWSYNGISPSDFL